MENEKKTTTSNAEMVTISRAEYNELKLQNQWLLEQLGLAKKRQFGSSSEKMQAELMDQLSLDFNEAEAYAYGTKSATAEQVAHITLQRGFSCRLRGNSPSDPEIRDVFSAVPLGTRI